MEMDLQHLPSGYFVYHSQIHFDELSPLWFLHHTRQLAHIERAQHALFEKIMEVEGFDTQANPDLYAFIANVNLDCVKPIKGAIPYAILLHVKQLRAAALTIGFEFRSEDGKILYSKGERTVCRLGENTHEPALWSTKFFQRYSEWEKMANETPTLIHA